MKKFVLVLILAVVFSSDYASAAPTTGVWNIFRLGTNVTLTQDGATITGTFHGLDGNAKLTGTLGGDIFTGWYFDGRSASRCGPNNEWDHLLLLKFSADGRSVTGDWGNCSDTHASLSPTSSTNNGTLQSGSPILFGQNDPPPVTGSGPALGIWANQIREQLNVTENDILSIVIGLDKNNYAGVNADWWLVLLDAGAGEFYHYRFDGTWQEGLIASYQGPISDLPEFEALNARLVPGTYYFYFGVDPVVNGQVDFDQLYYDFVQVNVQ